MKDPEIVMLGYSSGKDSETVLHLFLMALIRAVRTGQTISQHHFVIHTDTLIESPEVRWLADKKLAALERFRSQVEQQSFSRVGKITASIGFSALRPNDTPTDVIDRADEALYYAKRHGRNRVDSYERLIAGGELQAKEIAKGEVELF